MPSGRTDKGAPLREEQVPRQRRVRGRAELGNRHWQRQRLPHRMCIDLVAELQPRLRHERRHRRHVQRDLHLRRGVTRP